MSGNLQPLDEKFPIVDAQGRPTLYFTKWAQQKQIDIGDSLTLADLVAFLTAHKLQEGSGIQFAPDGDINNTPIISADVQEILDQITATRGAILYRGLLGWSALLPGTSGFFLKTNGAGADPAWAAGGGSGATERTRVIPTTSNFTLDNAGTASAANTTFGLALTVPNVASQIRFLRSNAGPPATPYSMIVRASPICPYSAAQLYGMCLIARNSSNGRIIIYGDYNSGQHLVQRWSSYSAFSANALGPFAAFWNVQLPWMRMKNDGTNLIFGRSPDGEEWFDVHSEPLATYLTAAGGSCDQIGMGTMMNGIGFTVKMMFQSFEVV